MFYNKLIAMDMRIDLQNFYDVISFKTGSNVSATAVIESVLNHL